MFSPVFTPFDMDPRHSQYDDKEETLPEASAMTREPGGARRAGWSLQENVFWPGADAARAGADRAKWGFESLGWELRSRLAWPLKDSFLRSGPIGRTAMAAGAVVLLAGVGVAGALVGDGGQGSTEPAAAPLAQRTPPPPVQKVIAPNAAKPVADTRVLKGAAPTFGPEADAAESGAATDDAVPADSAGTSSSSSTKSAASKAETVGPAPLKVAHRFADAFVSYEVGKASPTVRKVFRKTATQPLAKSLAKRPPRQPAAVSVPRAKVLNVVPGPRRGPSVSVSVSLLRVGAASELRLQLQQVRRKWLVSDVRG